MYRNVDTKDGAESAAPEEERSRNMSYIVTTGGLTKTIKGHTIVSGVDLHVKQGEIYGFLGPNGAGKTTVMKMLTGLWRPTAGNMELFGHAVLPGETAFLKRMGIVIEFPVFFEHLSGRKNLQLHCEYMGYYSPGCVEQALKLLELQDTGEKPVRTYSLGMKQRLGIARAVLTKPELLILDEPANGLDPAGMKQIRDLLRMLCQEYGMTVMLSSHILSEVESIADTVGLLNHGKMVKEIGMRQIEEMNLSCIELETENVKRAAYVLTEKLNLGNLKVMDEKKIRIYDHTFTSQEIAKILAEQDVSIVSLERRSESLEDYFLKMTAEEKGGAAPCGN